MVLRVDGWVMLVLLHNILLLAALGGVVNRYKYGMACLITFITYSSSQVVCKFRFALELVAFLFHIPVFEFSVPLFPSSSFSFSTTSAAVSGGGAGAGTSWSSGRSRDSRADLQFPVSDFICEYGTYIDSQRFSGLWMNGDSGLVWDVWI